MPLTISRTSARANFHADGRRVGLHRRGYGGELARKKSHDRYFRAGFQPDAGNHRLGIHDRNPLRHSGRSTSRTGHRTSNEVRACRRRRFVLSELGKVKSLSCAVPRGAFYVFPDFSRFENSDEVLATQLLQEARVATAPGSGFGRAGEGHLRISYSPDYEQVREGTERLRSHVERRC